MRLWREPLVHFAVLGVVLFAWFGVGDDRPAPDEIVITAAQVDSLAESWRRTWQRPPTRSELDGLIEERITEEVLYREALALGLDRDDTVVRRRLRQKIEFLSDDVSAFAEPSDVELGNYLAHHADRFRVGPRISFQHVYLSADRSGPPAQQRAEILLTELREHAPGEGKIPQGDPIAIEPAFAAIPSSDVTSLFGADFAEALFRSPLGEWSGPLASEYGLHLVHVSNRTDPFVPPLADVRDAVKLAWQEDQRAHARAEFVRRLRERYVVTIDRPAWASDPAETATR